MEGLRRIARAHYEVAPLRVKSLANDFFRQLDYDGNGWVSLPEFISFMRQYSDRRMSSPDFFMVLDRDANGVLDFWEVITLYYIIKSRRPFCDWCSRFITATYYSCMACFHSRQGPFNLCLDCYRSCQCGHNHNGRVQFLDNYTLLELKRTTSMPSQGMGSPSTQQRPSQALVRSQSSPGTRNIVMRRGSFNQSNAIVPAQRRSGWSHALRALELGLSIGNIATTLCSIL